MALSNVVARWLQTLSGRPDPAGPFAAFTLVPTVISPFGTLVFRLPYIT